eukprot:TRINITY_DN44724_c0_g1_i1.p1 TRINITY_DN44724_c0_g1~~TRINITY_DN44724_c0_g1_i1.p1  ORF type:complete len:935 (+),score=193.40 TRINITY_DN44724_c0_g1_i1:91-2895(+)
MVDLRSPDFSRQMSPNEHTRDAFYAPLRGTTFNHGSPGRIPVRSQTRSADRISVSPMPSPHSAALQFDLVCEGGEDLDAPPGQTLGESPYIKTIKEATVAETFLLPASCVQASKTKPLLEDSRLADESNGHEDVLRPPSSWLRRKTHFLCGDEPFVGFVYGVVNWIVCVPTLVSYAAIVFVGSRFKHSMPLLVKLYFLSSAIHQFAFIFLSTLDFAVGQVQDVGLIFLSAMVTRIVLWAKEDNLSDDQLVATCLWQCAGSTTIVGLCVIAFGKMRLGQYVQMIPLPVVGGYLGYIGYFCFVAGLNSATDLEVSAPHTWGELLQPHVRMKTLGLVGMTMVMLLVHFRVRHFMGMPVTLLVLPILFFCALPALGVSVEECRQQGWLSPPVAAADGIQAFNLFDPSLVRWDYLTRQMGSLFGLVVVVSFGSSLDVAAIQAEMAGVRLDYNNELITVGLANLFSGVCGGATGSYIFSQTIFSQKQGVSSRLNGIVVAVGELVLFCTSMDILAVLPKIYIGGIMCLFGVDIMSDWLLFSRPRMSRIEYGLLWMSFACVSWRTAQEAYGVIDGMLISSVIAASFFAYRYARTHAGWKMVSAHSSLTRPFSERQILDRFQPHVLAICMKGYPFFGSSLHMSQAIAGEADKRRARFVCIDFGGTHGADSTAAGQLKFLACALLREGREVLFSSASEELQWLLVANEVPGSEHIFCTLDDTLQYVEHQILQRSNVVPRALKPEAACVGELLLDFVEKSRPGRRQVEAAHALEMSFQRKRFRPGEVLYRRGEKADTVYIIAAGVAKLTSCLHVVSAEDAACAPSGMRPDCADAVRVEEPSAAVVADAGEAEADDGDGSKDEPPRIVRPGSIIGASQFYAHHVYGRNAVAEQQGCVAYALTRSSLEELEGTDDIAAATAVMFLQNVLLRDLSLHRQQFLVPKQGH